MGDRTWGQVVIVACPPQHVAAVAAVIDEYGLVLQNGGGGEPSTTIIDQVVLGEQYTDDQMTCGASAEIANKCDKLDGIAYFVSEDPKYEWLGDVHYRLPDGRWVSRDADSDQQIVLTESSWRAWVEQASPDANLRTALDTHFAVDIVDEFNRLRAEITALPEAERTLQVPDEEQE